MRTPNNKNLPDFREVPLDVFNAAIGKYHAHTDIKDLTDQELWIQYTKWEEVDTRVRCESGYALGLRLRAKNYLDALAAECRARGILA